MAVDFRQRVNRAARLPAERDELQHPAKAVDPKEYAGYSIAFCSAILQIFLEHNVCSRYEKIASPERRG